MKPEQLIGEQGEITCEYDLRVCKACSIVHYENCPKCFGFGMYVSRRSGNLVPVIANEAIGRQPMPANLIPCSYCGSTETGLGRKAR